MKKRRVWLPVLAITALIAVGHQGIQSFSANGDGRNSLIMENVEALSQMERPCDNINGYRQWSTSGFLKSEKEFYDCCYNLTSGYSPSGN